MDAERTDRYRAAAICTPRLPPIREEKKEDPPPPPSMTPYLHYNSASESTRKVKAGLDENDFHMVDGLFTHRTQRDSHSCRGLIMTQQPTAASH